MAKLAALIEVSLALIHSDTFQQSCETVTHAGIMHWLVWAYACLPLDANTLRCVLGFRTPNLGPQKSLFHRRMAEKEIIKKEKI